MQRLIILFMFCTTPLCAQEAPPQQSPEVQAISIKLMNEIGASIQCSAREIVLKQELAKAKTTIKQLTDKYEPTKNQTHK